MLSNGGEGEPDMVLNMRRRHLGLLSYAHQDAIILLLLQFIMHSYTKYRSNKNSTK